MTARLDVGPIVDRAIQDALDRRRPELGVLAELVQERARQDAKWGEQNHPDIAPHIVALATEEQLPAHGAAVTERTSR